jgi:hypothetical protein
MLTNKITGETRLIVIITLTIPLDFGANEQQYSWKVLNKTMGLE